MWLACLPSAWVPLWQAAQGAVAWLWSNLADVQLVTTWQDWHWLLVGRWFADLPCAKVPLWQAEHNP